METINLQVLETRRQERLKEFKEAVANKDISKLQQLIGVRIDEIISNKDNEKIFFDKDSELLRYQRELNYIFDNN